jgi:hypothetical protein
MRRQVAALFPPWTNTATHVVLAVVTAALIGVVSIPMLYARSPFATGQGNPRMQPVLFDHRHHVGDDEIDCLYCHGDAERSRYAGVPATEVCMGCHNQVWSDSALLAPVRESLATGTPIAWVRVHSLPDFVYFDHSIHVTSGVACATCHGRIDRMAAVYQVQPLTMRWCLDCHRAAERTAARSLTHCSACHR